MAKLSEQFKFVETIPHVEILSICHIDQKLCKGSIWAVPYERSKSSICVETKLFVLVFTYHAYETLP